jgi:hypothetical protein
MNEVVRAFSALQISTVRMSPSAMYEEGRDP